MKHSSVVTLTLALTSMSTGCVPSLSAQTQPIVSRPFTGSVILLEGAGDGDYTEVWSRTPQVPSASRRLGRVDHIAGSARRAAVRVRDGHSTVLLTVQEQEGRNAATYNTALYRVADGTATRLVGGLTDGSAPMVTASGIVLVQRGTDGEAVEPDPETRVLRERSDALSIDAVDVDTGAVRTVWRGTGQIAYLATTLRGDEVLAYHVDDQGGHLRAIDAQRASVRTVLSPFAPLARDFTFDRAHDRVVFARATGYATDTYDVVDIGPYEPAPQNSLRVRYRGASDRLMPHALPDGAIALSLPDHAGLGMIPYGQRTATSPIAPLGQGTDAVLGHSGNGQWLAVRHMDASGQREVLALLDRASGRAVHTVHRPDTVVEFVAFGRESE